MKKLLFLALFLFSAVNARAQSSCSAGSVDNISAVPFTQESITVSTSAVILTVATYRPTGGPNAIQAMISVGAQPIRVWFTGIAPTSTVGHYFAANTVFYVCKDTLTKLIMIRDTGATGDAVASVTYLRAPQ
tara:strand:+ start:338 stop:733 length:396 start_codon:yes stop_codon:yes gene_type:complete